MSDHGTWEARAWSCHAKTTVVSVVGGRVAETIAECSGSGQIDISECERRAALIADVPALLNTLLAYKAEYENPLADYTPGPQLRRDLFALAERMAAKVTRG